MTVVVQRQLAFFVSTRVLRINSCSFVFIVSTRLLCVKPSSLYRDVDYGLVQRYTSRKTLQDYNNAIYH